MTSLKSSRGSLGTRWIGSIVLEEVVEWVGESCRVAYRSAYRDIKQGNTFFKSSPSSCSLFMTSSMLCNLRSRVGRL
jgi:hypothetical protein